MNKKGIILISVYLVLIVSLAIIAGAFFVRAAYESKHAQQLKDGTAALYEAETGIQCVYHEMRSGAQGWDWTTHIDKDTPDPNAAIPTSSGYKIPGSAISRNTKNYIVSGRAFEAKVFKEPGNSDITVVLSRATVGQETRAIEYKLAKKSLFEYYFFSPTDLVFQEGTYDAGNGEIHSNGNIELRDNAAINNLSEMTSAGFVYYNINPSTPGSYSSYAPYIYWSNDYKDVPDAEKYGYHKGDGYAYSGAKINGTTIPSTLASASYQRDVWLWPSGKFPLSWLNPPSPNYQQTTVTNSREQPDAWKDFLNANGLADIIKDGANGGYIIAPCSGLRSKFYWGAGSGVYINKYRPNVHSGTAPLDWGCYNPTVGWYAATLGDMSQYNDRIVKFVPYWNARKSPGGNYYSPTYVVEVDVAKLIAANKYKNGKIYCYYSVRLVNAATLPPGGLTVYSDQAVELKGDFNTVNWQPAAVIADGGVYTLSTNFESDPDKDNNGIADNASPHLKDLLRDPDPDPNGTFQRHLRDDSLLPATVQHINYPYEDQPGYYPANEQYMPNKAGRPEEDLDNPEDIIAARYNVAIVTGADVSGYELERWGYYTNPSGQGPFVQRKKVINGVFIRLPTDYANLVSSVPVYKRNRSKPGDPFYHSPSIAELTYDTRLLTQKPPGDFTTGGYDLSWREIDPADF